MPFMRLQILGIWFRGLLSIAILAGGIYLLKEWYDDSTYIEVSTPKGDLDLLTPEQRRDRDLEAIRNGTTHRVFHYEPGWNRGTALLAGGIALLAWATLGRRIGQGLFMLTLRPGSSLSPSPSSVSDQTESSGTKRESKKVRREKARRRRAGDDS